MFFMEVNTWLEEWNIAFHLVAKSEKIMEKFLGKKVLLYHHIHKYEINLKFKFCAEQKLTIYYFWHNTQRYPNNPQRQQKIFFHWTFKAKQIKKFLRISFCNLFHWNQIQFLSGFCRANAWILWWVFAVVCCQIQFNFTGIHWVDLDLFLGNI